MDALLIARFDSLAWVVFAQDGGGATGLGMWPAFIVIGLLFYFMLIRPQRREQSKRSQMLEQLKKNDHIVTIGGIYGVVTNVRKEKDEVTVRVDEKTNAELTFTLASISRVLNDSSGEEKTSGSRPSK